MATIMQPADAACNVDLSSGALESLTRELAERAEAYDRSATFPREAFDILARRGLVGLTVHKRFGGPGAGFVDALRVLGAVAKGEPSTALILFMIYAFHGLTHQNAAWDEGLYARMAREALEGRGLIGFFRVEPDLGTPARGGMPKTIARRTASGWALSGEKIYCTGSTGLDWFSVWAATDEASPRLGMFLVDPSAPGIRIEPEWDHLGMRATVSHRVVFDNVPLPDSAATDIRAPAGWQPKPDDDPRPLLWNALAIAVIYDGVARAARDWLAAYLNDRVPGNLGASLATLPRVQEKFGEIEALLLTNRTLIENMAQRADSPVPPGLVEGNLVKHIANANAIQAVQIGLELTGNPGISRNNPLERHYRDVLCSRIHSPQSDSVLTAAGKAALAR